MSDIVERLEALARAEHDDLSVASEAASRIRELDRQVEENAKLRRELWELACRKVKEADAALADNERLREALSAIRKHAHEAAVGGDLEDVLRQDLKVISETSASALKGDTNGN